MLAFGFALARPGTASAGEWHRGPTLKCNQCHSMHAGPRQSVALDPLFPPPPGDSTPHDKLLRRATTIELCTSCHDGSNANAPDVIAPQAPEYVAVKPGAGAFQDRGGTASPFTHDLSLANPVVPPLGDREMILTCASCHAPHGSDSFRNLRANPSGSGATNPLVLAAQLVLPDGRNPQAVYASANVTHQSGMSSFCRDCHTGAEGADMHPVDRPIAGGFASYAAWSSPLENRVRAQSPTDLDIPSTDDEVTCISCHRAHGSPQAWMLEPDGFCAQCHDQ